MQNFLPVSSLVTPRSGVLTLVDEDPTAPVDVTRLAAEVGIEARVTFAPEVWAYCEPGALFQDAFMTMALRDQYARHILQGLRRNLSRFREGRMAFRSNGVRRSARLVAQMDGDVDLPAIVVTLAA